MCRDTTHHVQQINFGIRIQTHAVEIIKLRIRKSPVANNNDTLRSSAVHLNNHGEGS